MAITSPVRANALAAMIAEIRADLAHTHNDKSLAWPESSVVKFLHANRGDPATYHQICTAAIAYASNPAKRTPKFMFERGPHWGDTKPRDENGYDTSTPKEPCPDHPTYNADTCGSCQGDINAGLRPPEYKGLHFDPYDHGLID